MSGRAVEKARMEKFELLPALGSPSQRSKARAKARAKAKARARTKTRAKERARASSAARQGTLRPTARSARRELATTVASSVTLLPIARIPGARKERERAVGLHRCRRHIWLPGRVGAAASVLPPRNQPRHASLIPPAASLQRSGSGRCKKMTTAPRRQRQAGPQRRRRGLRLRVKRLLAVVVHRLPILPPARCRWGCLLYTSPSPRDRG